MKIMLILLLALYITVVIIGYAFKYMNLRHLERFGGEVPDEFAGQIDRDLLRKTRDYTVENTRFGFIESSFSNLVLIVFLFAGLIAIYNRFVISLTDSFILAGIIFFLVLSYVSTILSIPFDLYSTFRIENRYGFNTMTPRLWLTDLLKSLLLTTVLMGVLLFVGFWLIKTAPETWWLWVWGFLLLFGIFMMYISPYVIEPLFNKYTPIDDPALEEKIQELMEKVGIRVSRIFKMDASRRSRHTNAYFTGIGRVKRIILYDTLLDKLNKQEILAVLAHEAGHWKKRHLLKGIILSQVLSFAGIYIAYHLTRTDMLTDLFGIQPPSIFAKLMIIGFVFNIVSFPFTPFFNLLSRYYEREADEFACRTTDDSGALATSLIKLAKDNLSNLHPHPWYAAFYYSHPPVVERVRRIRGF
jgi:STE24 endopeptidase